MYLDRLRLDGKNALIFGAGGVGMSMQTSLALAEAGATVIPVDVTEEKVTSARRRIEEIGGRSASGTTADLLDMDAAARAVADAIEQVGDIHILVNVAGGTKIGQWRGIEDTPYDVYAAVFDLNLNYTFVTCREVGKHMIERGIRGTIVNYASVSGLRSAPYHGPYGAAKAGMMALTRTMAVEWGRYGIRVNAVAPGSVGGSERRRALGEPLPTGENNPLPVRPPEDAVPSAVLFLVSDLAATITGQTVVVDAGITAASPLGSAASIAPRVQRDLDFLNRAGA
jgi:NAD(P)-dependent dehydrogenase (short-subunit alcohol dehydrogenase family)